MSKNSRSKKSAATAQSNETTSSSSISIDSAAKKNFDDLNLLQMMFPLKTKSKLNDNRKGVDCIHENSSINNDDIPKKNISATPKYIHELMTKELEDYQNELRDRKNSRNDFSNSNNMDDDDDDNSDKDESNMQAPVEYNVENIAAINIINGIVHFNAKWEGYSSSENTNEMPKHLDNSLIIVKDFIEKCNQKNKNGEQIICSKIKDKSIAFKADIWKNFPHLIEPEEIKAFDLQSQLVAISFKNEGEIALVSIDEFIKNENNAKMFLEFISDHSKEFLKRV